MTFTLRSQLSFGILLSLLCLPVVSAEHNTTEQPVVWLHKMDQALDQHSFSGRFVHVMGNKIRSLQLLHTQINGDTYERLTHLDGPKAEIIRQGSKIYCYFPGHATIVLNQPAKPQARLNTSPVSRNLNLPIPAIEAHYHLSQLPQDRIAGLKAIPIRLAPRDTHRYQYEFWLEAESGLLIKSSISTSKGELLENFEFTQLALNANLPISEFQAEHTAATAPANKTPPKDAQASSAVILPDWHAQWLPDGFIQTNMQINSPQQPHNPLAMKLFTDGLATFSIFIERLPANSELLPSTTQGATLSTSRWLDAKDHRYAATLLGEIPMQSARQIIESITLVAAN
jgi:sigma-E factor negative regulatory protein RseB